MGNETEKKQVRKESSQMQIAPPQSDAKPGNAPSLDNTWVPRNKYPNRDIQDAFRGISLLVKVPLCSGTCCLG